MQNSEVLQQWLADDFVFVDSLSNRIVGATSMEAGLPKRNVIPSLAEATLDCRLLPLGARQ